MKGLSPIISELVMRDKRQVQQKEPNHSSYIEDYEKEYLKIYAIHEKVCY